MTNGKVKEWVCKTLVEGADVRTRGLAEQAALWTAGQTLTIGFLEGSPRLQDRVFETARRWTNGNEGGANLSFKQVDTPTAADIRIAFDPNSGSWSHVGTYARKNVAAGKPTMNLGWATETTPDGDFASVVLHEFGHALGLLHEHNHPDADLKWNKDAVYADLMGPPNNWSRQTIDFNVFESYPRSRVVMSANPDLVSIMIYTIPAHWLMGQPAVMPSDHLSPGDIDFIRQLYA